MAEHHYTVFDKETGAIIRSGTSTSKRAAALQAKGDNVKVSRRKVNHRTHFMPDGKVTKREAEPERVHKRQVKEFAARLLSRTDWYIVRELETAAEIPPEITEYRQAVRDASGKLEMLDPIPADFRDPKHWPVP